MTSHAEATLRRLRRAIRRAALRTLNPNQALTSAELLGLLNWHNNDGLLSEEAVEAELHARHGAAIAASAPPQRHARVNWLHVISEALPFGGHTRLLEMLLGAQARAGKRVAVAVTRSGDPGFREAVAQAGATLHLLDGTRAERVSALIALGRTAERIVLHIHPDDAGAALAARLLRSEGREVLFVNHADHAFSYGPGAADVCLEVSGFGWRLSAARRAIHAQHFLGIPVEESARSVPEPDQNDRPPQGPVFSMGNGQKYQPANAYDFPAFVSHLLDRTDAEMEIVGPSPSKPWWTETLERHGDRIRLLGPRPYKETSARLAVAAAYVDSFPMNGGTAFPQALMAGKTVFGPGADHGGYSLADTLLSPTVEAMTEALIAFLRTGAPPKHEGKVRRSIAEEFNADAIAARLEAAAEGDLRSPPPELMAAPRRLDHFVDVWRADGRVTFDLAAANGLPGQDRLALAWACRSRPLGLKGAGRKTVLLWALRGH